MATVFPSQSFADNSLVNPQQAVGTALPLAASATINSNMGVVRVSPAAAVAGIILQPGILPGQTVTIISEAAAANTITFAASGTSNVADGVADVITGPSAREFVWDSITALWYAIH